MSKSDTQAMYEALQEIGRLLPMESVTIQRVKVAVIPVNGKFKEFLELKLNSYVEHEGFFYIARHGVNKSLLRRAIRKFQEE